MKQGKISISQGAQQLNKVSKLCLFPEVHKSFITLLRVYEEWAIYYRKIGRSFQIFAGFNKDLQLPKVCGEYQPGNGLSTISRVAGSFIQRRDWIALWAKFYVISQGLQFIFRWSHASWNNLRKSRNTVKEVLVYNFTETEQRYFCFSLSSTTLYGRKIVQQTKLLP